MVISTLLKLSERLLYILKISSFLASVILLTFTGAMGFYAYSQKPYIVEEYPVARASAVSEYSLMFELAPNDIYGTTLPYEGKKLPVYLSLLREVVIQHFFRMLHTPASGNYSIEVVLVHPDGWSKTYSRKSEVFSNKSLVASVTRLNITETHLLMRNLAEQADIRLTAYSINITTSIYYSVNLDSETRRDSITHTVALGVDFFRGLMEVRGGLRESKSMSVFKERTIPVVFAGLTIETLRIIAPVLGVAGVALLSTYMYILTRVEKTHTTAKLERKYKDIIVESIKPPEFSSMDVVALKDIEELAKAARILEKPIVKTSLDKTVYYLVDRKTAYIVEE